MAGVPSIDSIIPLDGKVIVFWSSVTNATSYNLYYAVGDSVDKSKAKVINVKSPDTVAFLTNGTKYAFALSAISDGGETILGSIKVCAPKNPVEVPSTPSIRAIWEGDGQVTITWVTVDGATSYNLYYASGSSVDKTFTKLTNLASLINSAGISLQYDVKSLINGNMYSFAITAQNDGGESNLSLIVTGTPK